MNHDPLYFLTIDTASSMIKSKELSPVELTNSFLERITNVDQDTMCYLEVLRESALTEARMAENEIVSGHYRGPLHGIPLAHKDLYDT
jgi:aspartyl-tRNA(Asn)/glutamyl-tRNA(Gln) amidotransferase subunit A